MRCPSCALTTARTGKRAAAAHRQAGNACTQVCLGHQASTLQLVLTTRRAAQAAVFWHDICSKYALQHAGRAPPRCRTSQHRVCCTKQLQARMPHTSTSRYHCRPTLGEMSSTCALVELCCNHRPAHALEHYCIATNKQLAPPVSTRLSLTSNNEPKLADAQCLGNRGRSTRLSIAASRAGQPSQLAHRTSVDQMPCQHQHILRRCTAGLCMGNELRFALRVKTNHSAGVSEGPPAADSRDAERTQQLLQAGASAPVLGVRPQRQVRQGRQRGRPPQGPAAEPCTVNRQGLAAVHKVQLLLSKLHLSHTACSTLVYRRRSASRRQMTHMPAAASAPAAAGLRIRARMRQLAWLYPAPGEQRALRVGSGHIGGQGSDVPQTLMNSGRSQSSGSRRCYAGSERARALRRTTTLTRVSWPWLCLLGCGFAA